MQPLRFLIIDDHPLFLEALEMALHVAFPAARVETAGSIEAAHHALAKGARPDLILLDLKMPDIAGFEGVVSLKAASPRTPLCVISSMSGEEIIRQLRDLGAAGFINKSEKRGKIIAAVRQLIDGKDHFGATGEPPAPAGVAAGQRELEILVRLRELTPQQYKVLALICEGKLNKQIAYELDIVETTVKAHITSIFKKLAIHNRTQAVLIMQKLKLQGLIIDQPEALVDHERRHAG
ncbi:MAG TPA: response regulator transcription factor [Nordella sp.]|nr:response regulator transcription factor [Nordella sp.]